VAQAPKATGKKPKPAPGQSRPLSFKEKREYEQLEAQIEAWEAEKQGIEAQLYGQPSPEYGEVTRLSEQLAALTSAIDQGTERWLELAERLGA
jgi:ATP-binding cassette subfamily F protein uup